MSHPNWILGKCACCGAEAMKFADACPTCGVAFRTSKPSGMGWVLCLLSWVVAVGVFATSKSDLQIAVAAAVGAGGIAWLAALREMAPVKGTVTK